MHIRQIPEVTPEKIYPLLKKADTDQLKALYLPSYHIIRGGAPDSEEATVEKLMDILKEGTNRQRLLIIQAAFHIVRRERMRDTFQIL